jgi:hypothetical protein
MIFYNCVEIEQKLYNSRILNLVLMILLIVSLMFNFKDAFSASLYAPDGTYLGEMTANPMAYNSISNPLSQYGSEFSNTSINNPYSQYGSELSNQSPNNPYASTPEVDALPSLSE